MENEIVEPENICANCCEHSSTLTDTDRGSICDTCKSELYYTCDCCQNLVDQDDANYQDDLIYCESCFDDTFSNCDDCGSTHRSDALEYVNGSSVCGSCLENNYTSCQSCDEYTHSDYSYYCSDCDEGSFCETCYNSHRSDCTTNNDIEDLLSHGENLEYEGSDAIADYHPSVEWENKIDRLDPKSRSLFGVELEIEASDCVHDVAKKTGELLKGKMIACHDGSLSDGFEIVFTPHKKESFRKLNLYKVLPQLTKLGARSHDTSTCGLHVHIDRCPWFKSHINKRSFIPVKAYHTNADLYQGFFMVLKEDILKMSRRKSFEVCESYCRFQRSNHQRYCMVNLSNSETIEVRVWKGTLNHTTLKACVSFTLAVKDFLMIHSKTLVISGNEERLKTAFHNWLKSDPEYASLVKYLTAKKLFNF